VDVINREWSNNGFSKPHFFKNNDGETHLFCGNEDGKILHYIDIDENLFDGGTFRRLKDLEFWLNNRVQMLSEGSFTALAVADFNGDGLLDMVVGNHRGGLTIFFGIKEIPVKNKPVVETGNSTSLQIFPNPVQTEFVVSGIGYQVSGGYLEIFDLTGRRVQIEPLPITRHPSPVTVNISHLRNGVYFLKIGDQVAKFVKQ
jgi:hypothetical protein